MTPISAPPLHPAEFDAVRTIVREITLLLEVANEHIAHALYASKAHPVNRQEELQLARSAADVAIRLATRLAYLIGGPEMRPEGRSAERTPTPPPALEDEDDNGTDPSTSG